MIPLFDSLSHPTLTGRWFQSGCDARIATLLAAMREHGFAAACAVGLPGVEQYDHEGFANLCRPHDTLIPIAAFDPIRSDDIDAEMSSIRELGFRGIKLHPRLSGFTLRDPRFVAALASARRCDLPVFLCTYFHAPVAAYPAQEPLYEIVAALKHLPGLRLVLVHGGDIELMRYVQLARHSDDIIVDLSFTLMKYRGSSLDADIRYLFGAFSRGLCLGVDHPEFRHSDVRQRFEELSAGVGEEDRANVAYRSLQRFLKLDADRFVSFG